MNRRQRRSRSSLGVVCTNFFTLFCLLFCYGLHAVQAQVRIDYSIYRDDLYADVADQILAVEQITWSSRFKASSTTGSGTYSSYDGEYSDGD